MKFLHHIAALLLVGLVAGSANAADADPDSRACLSRAEQNAAVAAKRAIPLAQAIKSLRSRGHRAELLQARLCRRGEGHVYVLTLLPRSGKVLRATVDAANGELINVR